MQQKKPLTSSTMPAPLVSVPMKLLSMTVLSVIFTSTIFASSVQAQTEQQPMATEVSTSPSFSQCQTNPIKATYKVTHYKAGSHQDFHSESHRNTHGNSHSDSIDYHRAGSYPLTIYRNDNTVIYDYPQLGLSDVWHNYQGSLELSRYFHNHHRAIDYTSSDLNNVGNTNRWEKLYSLVSIDDTALESSTNTHNDAHISTQDCDKTIELNDEHKKVSFLKAYQLPKKMMIEANNKKFEYTLINVEANNQMDKLLADFSDYDAMDYSDIGDNEADPFLSQMINLGFIENSHNHGDH